MSCASLNADRALGQIVGIVASCYRHRRLREFLARLVSRAIRFTLLRTSACALAAKGTTGHCARGSAGQIRTPRAPRSRVLHFRFGAHEHPAHGDARSQGSSALVEHLRAFAAVAAEAGRVSATCPRSSKRPRVVCSSVADKGRRTIAAAQAVALRSVPMAVVWGGTRKEQRSCGDPSVARGYGL